MDLMLLLGCCYFVDRSYLPTALRFLLGVTLVIHRQLLPSHSHLVYYIDVLGDFDALQLTCRPVYQDQSPYPVAYYSRYTLLVPLDNCLTFSCRSGLNFRLPMVVSDEPPRVGSILLSLWCTFSDEPPRQ